MRTKKKSHKHAFSGSNPACEVSWNTNTFLNNNTTADVSHLWRLRETELRILFLLPACSSADWTRKLREDWEWQIFLVLFLLLACSIPDWRPVNREKLQAAMLGYFCERQQRVCFNIILIRKNETANLCQPSCSTLKQHAKVTEKGCLRVTIGVRHGQLVQTWPIDATGYHISSNQI